MTCIVQKYGGSSVADVDKLRKIVELIAGLRDQNFDVAVVVSAMGKTTDELVMMAREISPKPPRREMDMLLSTGERITMSLLSMALNERGLSAVSLTGSQAGIITNDRHNDAQVIEVRPFRVQDEMAKGKVAIFLILSMRATETLQPWGAAARIPPLWPWRRPWMRSAVRFILMWMVFTRPIHPSRPTPAICRNFHIRLCRR